MSTLALPETYLDQNSLQALADKRIEQALQLLEALEIDAIYSQKTNAFYDCRYFSINRQPHG